MTHAKLSPSSSHRWIPCAAAPTLEAAFPNETSKDAAIGLLCHEVAGTCLKHETNAEDYVGVEFVGHDIPFTADLVDAVQTYVDAVRDYAQADSIYVETKVPVGFLTGEEGAEGTADAIILAGDTLQIHDAKFGRMPVAAERNEQLMMYALGALSQFGIIEPFKKFLLVIHQPALNRVDEWACTLDELNDFARDVSQAAQLVELASHRPHAYASPSAKACRHCKAKSTCPAAVDKVQKDIGAMFTDLTAAPSAPINISEAGRVVEYVEMWCAAVRKEIARQLFSGTSVEGFKLVKGREGNREWTDAKEVAQHLTSVLKNDAYERSLISPTKAEKLLKKHPVWAIKVEPLIKRSPGKPSIVPASDKRSAMDMNTELEFKDLTTETTHGENR